MQNKHAKIGISLVFICSTLLPALSGCTSQPQKEKITPEVKKEFLGDSNDPKTIADRKKMAEEAAIKYGHINPATGQHQ
jgi:hypothetical protein